MAAAKTNQKKKHVFKRELPLHMMLIPGIIFTFIFCYIPMAGMVIAFQKFMLLNPLKMKKAGVLNVIG